jgi:hypothetical protein
VGDELNPQTAWGLLGGAPGAEVAVLATADAPDDEYFWLVMARAYPWAADEDRSLVGGTYRFASLALDLGGGGASGASGTMTFDAASGTVTYEGTAHDVRFSGYGSYDVDPVSGVVTFQRLDGNPGAREYTLSVGTGANLLLGAGTDPAMEQVTEVLVLGR